MRLVWSIFTNIKHNIQLTDIGKTVCKIKKLSDWPHDYIIIDIDNNT